MSPLKKDRYQQVKDLIDGLNNKIVIPIHIDSHTTSVRISYHDGPIPKAIGYVFLVSRNGKCDFTIKDWKGNTSSIQVDSFNWTQFEQLFNLQKLKYEQNTEELFEGGSFTTIELYNGKSVTVRAEQQTGGISNAGNLVGNVNPLHEYICSIPEVNSLIAKTRNVDIVEPEPTPAPKPKPQPAPKPTPQPKPWHDEQTVVAEVTEVSASQHKQTKGKHKASQRKQTKGKHNGHEWVDLGLSVKWATCNIGADSPEDYGDYFAWGETETKSEYTDANCKTIKKQSFFAKWFNFGRGNNDANEENLPDDISGNAQYDAARVNWGGSWRMPTWAEMEELCDENKCDWTWTYQGDHEGYEVTGPNGNSIFLPAAGWRVDTDRFDEDENGYYWSSTTSSSNSDDASYLDFDSRFRFTLDNIRSYGQSVRPVTE